jgi:hypothetical protein
VDKNHRRPTYGSVALSDRRKEIEKAASEVGITGVVHPFRRIRIRTAKLAI